MFNAKTYNKRPLGRAKSRWEDSTETGLKGIRYKGMS
jgi:hypothetical protein